MNMLTSYLFRHRVYARQDGYLNTNYALQRSVELLKELERYANYTYELPKMFSAAIPDFGAGESFSSSFFHSDI